ncbi:MAG: energy transducer TonB, partial [Candidatus Neomarinimicrobiota bacterium]
EIFSHDLDVEVFEGYEVEVFRHFPKSRFYLIKVNNNFGFVPDKSISTEYLPNIDFLGTPKKSGWVAYDDPPYPKSKISPKYPKKAREKGYEGTVIVSVFVNEKGKVTETAVIKSIPGSGLDESAINSIKKVRFKPAKKEGKPVGVWISIPVHFRLKGK